MGFTARIFALILAITSLAVPCFADISGHKNVGTETAVETRLCDGSGKSCSKLLPEAILKRTANLVNEIAPPTSDDAMVQIFNVPAPAIKKASYKRIKIAGLNCRAVDLYFLCRQLN